MIAPEEVDIDGIVTFGLELLEDVLDLIRLGSLWRS